MKGRQREGLFSLLVTRGMRNRVPIVRGSKDHGHYSPTYCLKTKNIIAIVGIITSVTSNSTEKEIKTKGERRFLNEAFHLHVDIISSHL